MLYKKTIYEKDNEISVFPKYWLQQNGSTYKLDSNNNYCFVRPGVWVWWKILKQIKNLPNESLK